MSVDMDSDFITRLIKTVRDSTEEAMQTAGSGLSPGEKEAYRMGVESACISLEIAITMYEKMREVIK